MINKRTRRNFLTRSAMMLGPLMIPNVLSKYSQEISYQSRKSVSDLIGIRTILEDKKAHIWVLTGDSITHGAKHTHGCRSYPEIFEERLRWELARVRDFVVNSGISGSTTRNLLQDFDWRIAQFKPSVVSFMIGTNDVAKGVSNEEYTANLVKLINKIRGLGAIPIVHTPNPIIIKLAQERSTLPALIPMIRQVVEEHKTILVDHHKHWTQTMHNTSEKEVFRKWLNDPLHPNQVGHQEIAKEMFKVLDIFDPAAPTCGAPFYEGKH